MNSRVKKLLKIVSDHFFLGQHPEAALRYYPVVDEIKKRQLENSKILEIGPGSLGIVPYLKKNIDGIDIDFSGPETRSLRKIKGSAQKLPFKDSSYDVTISVDVLEHLDPKIRKQAILEQLRTTKKLALVVVPCGRASELQDRRLRAKWNQLFKEKNRFFEEHIRYDLPQKKEILTLIREALNLLKKEAEIKSYPNLNIQIRNILMRTWITKNKFLYYLYLKGYLLLVPLLKFCNFGKTYRQVFVIEFPDPVNSHLEPYSNRIKKVKGRNNRDAS